MVQIWDLLYWDYLIIYYCFYFWFEISWSR